MPRLHDASLGLSLSLAVSGFVLGCAGFGSEIAEAPSGELPPCEQVRQVLEQSCVACHGATPSNGAPSYLRLDTFEDVDGVLGIVSQSGRSADRAAQRTMPPASFGVLTEAQVAILTSWHEAGAPLEGCEAATGAGSTPTPDAGTHIDAGALFDASSDDDVGPDDAGEANADAADVAERDPPTLLTLSDEVFGWCAPHHFGAIAPDLTYDAGLLDRLLSGSSSLGSVPYVVPGNPEGSYLYQKITNTHAESGARGGDYMPPSGLMPNSNIDLVQDWIAAGAPDPEAGAR